MIASPLTALVVTPSSQQLAALRTALAGRQQQFELRSAPGSEGVADALAHDSPDVILLDLATGLDGTLRGFVSVQARSGDVPIVVLADRADEALALKAVQLGAHDYLLREQLHGTLLARTLQFAVERSHLLSELDRRAAHWEEDDEAGPHLRHTAAAFGQASVRAAFPDLFTRLVDDYAVALDLGLEQRALRVQHDVPERLRALAKELGFVRAAPRDVVDLHQAALRERSGTSGPRKLEAYVAEARFQLVELMGYLVSYYRRYSIGARPRPHVPGAGQ